jgi:hypothetical protein
MNDNNVLSAEGSLLDRINTYQREIAILDSSLLVPVKPDKDSDSYVYGYQLTLSLLKSWTDDLSSVLSSDTEKQKINNNLLCVNKIASWGIFSNKVLQTISGSKSQQGVNHEVYKEFIRILSMSISILKGYTSKHFSSNKQNQRFTK